MLYRLNLKNSEDFDTILEEDLLVIDLNGMDLKTKELAASINKGDYIWIKCIKSYALAKVLRKANLKENKIYAEVKGYRQTSPQEAIKEAFDSKIFEDVRDGELIENAPYIYEKSMTVDFDKEDFVKKSVDLVDIKKVQDLNKNILKNVQRGLGGELIIELEAPKSNEDYSNLPMPYEERANNRDDLYFELLRSQIDFCLELQKLTTSQLIKTQEIFNNRFFGKKNK